MSESIQNGKVVSFSYILRDEKGNIIEQTQPGQEMEYLHGNQNIIPGLEKELNGMKVGEMKNVKVKAKDAYGEFNDELIFKVPLANFPKEVTLEVGMEFQSSNEDGSTMMIVVKEVDGDNAIVDANHPMAGMNLEFDVTVKNVRTATSQELQHGHVHNHGHDH